MGPERLCSLGASRRPNAAHEPPKRQRDCATAEQEGFDACRLRAQPTMAGARSWEPLERKDFFGIGGGYVEALEQSASPPSIVREVLEPVPERLGRRKEPEGHFEILSMDMKWCARVFLS